MRVFRLLLLLNLSLLFVLGWCGTQEAFAATPTPSFTITATNVSLAGRGTATSQFTVTSVNGFTGQVGVICNGPDPNLFPEIVFPSCADPTQDVEVPANGSASGTMLFFPPWENQESMERQRALPGSAAPVLAGLFAGAGLLGLRLRKTRWCALIVAAAGLGLVSGAIGCLGNSGLQMTPGTYAYTLSGSGTGASATKTIDVTVHCNSCP